MVLVVKQADWSVHTQAGCKFYVNHATGEATTEVPWEMGDESKNLTDSLSTLQNQQPHSTCDCSSLSDDTFTTTSQLYDTDMFGEDGEGTGAHVYDGAEVHSFLEMLDEIASTSHQSSPHRSSAAKSNKSFMK